MEVLIMAKDDVTTTGGSTSPPETPRAYRIVLDVKYDLEKSEVAIASWSLDGFGVTGRDLFDLLERVPSAIEEWFQVQHGIEVLVMPMEPSFGRKERRLEDGYVAMPIRPLAAALRDMEPKVGR
jgi:hypothetical protein